MFKSLKFALVGIAVVVTAVLGNQVFRSIYNHGYQRGADSVATAADAAKGAALTRVRDSLRVAYDAGKSTTRDSDAAVRHDVSALNDRVARLHSTPVPTVAVSAAIDSASRTPSVALAIGDDSTRYLVHPNVGRWIQVANWKLAEDDSVIGEQQFAINVRFPTLMALRDGQNALLERSISVYDSLNDSQRDAIARLTRRVANLTPSRVEKGERLVTYALALYGAVEGGRRLFGGR